jgi:uncharacterized protein (TIRG00374 family)
MSRRILRPVLAVAVVAVAFVVVLPRLADYSDVWREVRDLSTPSLLLLAAATIANLATFPPALMAVLPGLGFWRAFALTQASTASTYLAPGGAAIGIASAFLLLRRWGFAPRSIGVAVTLTGIWNQLALLSFAPLALGLLTLTGGTHPLLRTVGLVGLALLVLAVATFAVALGSNRVARVAANAVWRLGRWSKRAARRGELGWQPDSVVRFRDETAELLARRGLSLTTGTVAGQLTVYVLLLVSLRAVGVSPSEVSWIEAFAAWSLVRLLGAVPITPGGVGVVEVGLTALLVGFGGDDAGVVAAVLVYRFLTVVPTLALGLAAGAVWRRLAPVG